MLVFDGKKYLGVIEERTVHLGGGDSRSTHCKTVAIKTPVLLPSVTASEAAQAFFSGRVKTLPVMEGEKLMGAITRWEVLTAMRNDGLFAGHSVRSHMTSPILTIDSKATVSMADGLMKQAHVRRLAALSNGHLVGLISVFDLLRAKTGAPARRPQMREPSRSHVDPPISSFMKTQVETIAPDASLISAAEKMLDKQVAALIVVDGERPIGIISAKDLFEPALYPKTAGNVLVSGLSDVEKLSADAIVAEGQTMLGKIGQSVVVEALTLHVKKTGKEYYVSGHIRGPTLQLSATYSDFDLMSSVGAVLDELHTQAGKHKHTGMEKRKVSK